jgi:hypothetical protein
MKHKNSAKHPGRKSPPVGPIPDPHGVRRGKSLLELIAEQGVKPVENVEDLAAPPGSLWRDDAELDEFLAEVRGRRRQEG